MSNSDFVFIDSGVGGIPYMTTLLEKKPEASCAYVADTANFPYGTKSHEQIVKSVSSLVKKICCRFSPSVIVVACNTISVNALETLRADFSEEQCGVKFVGTVPAIKLASKLSKKRKIGLLATEATCKNPYNLELKEKFASDCHLFLREDGELVSYIEHNAFTASRSELLQAVRPAVDFFRQNDCDVIILGCTHFLNIKDVFVEECGSQIAVVDSVDGVVRHALDVWGDFKGGKKLVSSPLRREGRTQQGASEGETSPSYKISRLFVTSFSDKEEALQYKVLCDRFGINFEGIL